MKTVSVFALHDTHGIPLWLIAQTVLDRGLMINWKTWMKDAIAAGWGYDKIKSTIHDINDSFFGNEWHPCRWIIPALYNYLMDSTDGQ